MPVLAMGDFNDEPFSRSLTEYALSSHAGRQGPELPLRRASST